MFKGLVVITCLAAANALAENNSLNLQLPSGSMNYQADSIRAGDLDCKNAIGGSTNVEFGITGIVNNAASLFSSEDPLNPQTKDIGVYARIVIPLDGPRERINCNDLFRLEMRKKQIEIERLELQVQKLRQLNDGGFEN